MHEMSHLPKHEACHKGFVMTACSQVCARHTCLWVMGHYYERRHSISRLQWAHDDQVEHNLLRSQRPASGVEVKEHTLVAACWAMEEHSSSNRPRTPASALRSPALAPVPSPAPALAVLSAACCDPPLCWSADAAASVPEVEAELGWCPRWGVGSPGAAASAAGIGPLLSRPFGLGGSVVAETALAPSAVVAAVLGAWGGTAVPSACDVCAGLPVLSGSESSLLVVSDAGAGSAAVDAAGSCAPAAVAVESLSRSFGRLRLSCTPPAGCQQAQVRRPDSTEHRVKAGRLQIG